MAGFNLALTDRISCPFDPIHVMNYSKFHNHFVKCQRAHPNDKRKSCPYNYSELIQPEDFEKHIISCPFRQNYISSSYNQNGGAKSMFVDTAPYNIKFGDDYKSYKDNKNEQSDDEEIDSISVIAERHRSNENISSQSSVLQKRGLGRGAFFRRLASLNINSQPKLEIETKPESNDDIMDYTTGFSWICSRNIRGRQKSPDVETNNGPSPTSKQNIPNDHLENSEREQKVLLKLGFGRGRLLS